MKQIPNDLFFAWVEDEIGSGRPVRFRMKGDSMFPLLRSNRDEVVLHLCAEEELEPMDVVLFRYKGRHLLHRIIRRDGNRLLIQGDGSYVAKEECCTGDVIGRVQAIVRPSGKTIAVDEWQWRLPSCLWQQVGCLRRPLLRMLKYLYRYRPLKDSVPR